MQLNRWMDAIEAVTHRPRNCQDSLGISRRGLKIFCVVLRTRLMFMDSATESVQ